MSKQAGIIGRLLLIGILLVASVLSARDVKPLCIEISSEHPLIIMMAPSLGRTSPGQIGRNIVDAWHNHYPDELKPYTTIQIEERVLDYAERIKRFRQMLDVVAQHDIPLVLQIADPHHQYTMPLKYVEELLREYPVIKGLNLTEMQIEYYTGFRGDLKYKVPAETAHLIDAIKLAAKYGRFTSVQLQKLRWPHVLADEVQHPLLKTMREYHEYVFPQNECIEPFFLARQTAVLGLWLSDVVDHFGMEPQSWFWEGASFCKPGIFAPLYENTINVPPEFYRPMILINAMTGGTVFSFEPYWDLWNEVNGQIGREVIYPTLLEIIRNRLIPSKAEILEKTRAAYQMNYCTSLEEFHVNVNDIDPLAGDGLLSRAAYGLFWRGLNYEIIPDINRYFFIPLLPWDANAAIQNRFDNVMRAGDFTTVEAYQQHLNQFYPQWTGGSAFVTEIGNATYVMQTCENLYQEQSYKITVPQWTGKPRVKIRDKCVQLTWNKIPGAQAYEIFTCQPPGERLRAYRFKSVSVVKSNHFEATLPDTGSIVFGISAIGSNPVRLSGKVNYLDSHVFLKDKSPLKHVVSVSIAHQIQQHDLLDLSDDPRPKQQTVWPTYTNVPEKFMGIAKEIIQTFKKLIEKYEQSDWKGVTSFYDSTYRDPNGYGREYVGRALKWWFERNQLPYILIQERDWDFSALSENQVRQKVWTRWRAIAIDDGVWGDHGLVRIPRHHNEEIRFTWKKQSGTWKIINTDPALPNFNEILWNARGYETKKVLVPSID